MMDMKTNTNTTKKTGTTDCRTCRAHLADLLLDEGYGARRPEVAAHAAECGDCGAELASLQRTMELLGEWSAPEVSAYFDSKLEVRLREAEAARPEGWWERARAFVSYSTGRHVRTLAAGSLGVVLALGGVAGVYEHQVMVNTAASPTVNDLRILDNNAQAIQQMDQLLDGSGPSGSDGTPPTS